MKSAEMTEIVDGSKSELFWCDITFETLMQLSQITTLSFINIRQ